MRYARGSRAAQARRVHRLLAALALAACAACGEREPDGTAGGGTQAVPITVTRVTVEDVPVVLESVGRLESLQAPLIAAEVDGRVLELGADEGDEVPAGALLALLDPIDYELNRALRSARIAAIEARIARARADLARYEELGRKQHAARQQLESARADVEVLHADLGAARAGLELAADDLRRTRVFAPLAGAIDRRHVSIGDYVRRGDPLFRLVDIGRLRALLPFPEARAPDLKVAQEVELRTAAGDEPAVTGTITTLRPQVGTGSRAVVAIVELPNPGGWRPGATVYGNLVLERHAGALTVPLNAIVRRPAGDVAYVVTGERAAARSVRTGERRGGRIEIVSGLRADDVVAVDGAAYLTDLATVRIAEPAR
jgi:RND family efflux transporter MFP subunit